jgi:hypothetical protein
LGAAALVLWLDGCRHPRPITQLAGEIHIHQFATGGHVGAELVMPPIPLASAGLASLLEIPYAVAATAGACRAVVRPYCSMDCPPRQFCVARDTCGGWPDEAPTEAGAIDITGGQRTARVDLAWQPDRAMYLPSPLGASVFTGGELLHVHAAGGALQAFSADIVAPHTLVLTQPEVAPLRLPTVGPLALAWVPDATDNTGEIRALLTVDDVQGQATTWIQCEAADGDGSLVVPESLVALLPPPPRNYILEVTRNVVTIAPLGDDGVGVRVHAASEVQASGSQTTE